MKNEEKYYVVGDYEESNWLEDAWMCFVYIITLVVIFFIILFDKIFIRTERKTANQLAYLTGNAIREGDFHCLSVIPLQLLLEKRELIKNHLQFLFWKEPHLIIGLINLKTGEKEKAFLDEIMAELFSFSKQNLISAASKVLGSEMSIKNKALIVSYMAQQTKEEKREYFISFFRETFKKLGNPMKKEIEKIIGEKL